jgi:hypothetical protein
MPCRQIYERLQLVSIYYYPRLSFGLSNSNIVNELDVFCETHFVVIFKLYKNQPNF